jgi:hypothetical protein
MSTARPFARNTGAAVAGTTQVGNLAVGVPTAGFAATGLPWWNGPDEDLGYVIATQVAANNQPTPVGATTASVGFWRSSALTDASFISLAQYVSIIAGSPQTFATASAAVTWLNTNGYWTSYVTTPTYTIGQAALGGIITYILQSGDPGYDANVQHGLVVDSRNNTQRFNDVSYGIWGDGSYPLPSVASTSFAYGQGATNTTNIINAFGSNTAAGKARAYNGGGYNDWFLPSPNELFKIQSVFSIINTSVELPSSGFGPDDFPCHTSAQYSQQFAYRKDIPNGWSYNSLIYVSAWNYWVVPCRYF